jgi:hypothetical protein
LSDAACDFVDNDVVVRGIAAQQATQANDRVVFLGLGKSASGGRNFECARNADDLNIFACRAAARQSIKRAAKQSFRNELVKS